MKLVIENIRKKKKKT